MKIDEATINHNAVRIIDKILEYYYGLNNNDVKPKMETAIGEIGGVCMMAKAMKEVLRQ